MRAEDLALAVYGVEASSCCRGGNSAEPVSPADAAAIAAVYVLGGHKNSSPRSCCIASCRGFCQAVALRITRISLLARDLLHVQPGRGMPHLLGGAAIAK